MIMVRLEARPFSGNGWKSSCFTLWLGAWIACQVCCLPHHRAWIL